MRTFRPPAVTPAKKAVIIGASSGIGRALAVALAQEGFEVGAASRRVELLRSLEAEIGGGHCRPLYMDVREPDASTAALKKLVQDLGGMDLFIYNSGVNAMNPDFDLATELETIRVNLWGFVCLSNFAVKFFSNQNSGHLLGISSIAALRGSGRSPSYNAAKAFMSNYLAGLRQKLAGTPIAVTDVRPGYVDTEMIRGRKGVFWASTPEKAAREILDAIRKKKKVVYVTKRWGLAAGLFRIVPDWLYNMGAKRL